MAEESPQDQHQVKVLGWAARDSSGILSPFKFSRRATGEHDVQLKIIYCGICAYDVEMIKNKWGMTNYPVVFGHEAVGVVTEIGSKVQKFKVGDTVGVGTQVGSCGKCDCCTNDLNQYCPEMIATDGFGSNDVSYGACCDIMVVDENFVIFWPQNLSMDAGAPLLCAGITTYSPLRNFGLDKPGIHVGVVGLGGLGHVAVRFAKAFGVKVTVISTSMNKRQEALHKYGADSFLVSTEQEQMQAAVSTMNGIIDTSPAPHSLVPLLKLLKPRGKLILIGAPDKPYELPVFPLIEGGRIVAGSAIGSFRQTQEMIDFAARHNIVADVEVIPTNYLNTAVERIEKGDVKYRFVIDLGNGLKPA